jgi:hypothetical protein
VPEQKQPNRPKVLIAIAVIILAIVGVAIFSHPYGESMYAHPDDFVVAIFTVLLVAVGIGQLFLFWWQLDLIRTSLKDTKESADAAKVSADASTNAVKLAERTAKVQLRAYLALSTLSPLPDTYGGLGVRNDNSIVVQFYIKNTGQTPAYEIVTTLELEIDYPCAHDRLAATQKVIPPKIGGMVNPGEAITSGREFYNRYNPFEIDEVIQGRKHFHIFGKIEFMDAFKQRRWITFQFWCSGAYTHPENNSYRYWSISSVGNDSSDRIEDEI